ncbi:hypothetical protein NFI96_010994 [Prochilodus magdalenae]|nr:hypothetical protein NFI96_010994 [Prochilodus magdalenae]
MMNSKRVQSFMDPLAQGKMARLEGTIGTLVPPGLPKADNLPHYSQDKSSPYRRSYISCSLSGQEALDLPSAWSPSRTCVRNGGSPVVRSLATEGSITNPVFYRPENVPFPVDSGSPTAAEELAVKHKLAYYNRSKHSPNTTGVVSPVAVRKLPVACTSLSPSAAENSGLAIPKPVYGHGPCCADRKCAVGQSYPVEQGLQRLTPQMFEDDWAAHYGHWAYLRKKEQEALMQQRILPFEHCAERVPLKDVTPQGYHGLSPSRHRRISAFTEPSHSSYPYSPVHSFVPTSPEPCQRFQMRPQTHKDLPPIYEPLSRMHYGTSRHGYQDRPHIPKYGEIPQHSLLYCSQKNDEVYRPENPHHTVEKQALRQCPVPHPYYSDLPNPYSVVPTSHPATRNLCDYPGYRMHLNSSHVNLFTERPCPSPVMHQVDRPLDFSMRREQNTEFHREPHGQIGISGTFHQPEVPNHVVAQNCTLGSPDQSPDGFPVSISHNYMASPRCTGGISDKEQDLCSSDNPANSTLLTKRQREESDHSCKNDPLEKVKKIDQQTSDDNEPASSPPMPVINKVFSLAPYKAYLQAAGMFSPGHSSSPKLQADSKPPKEEPETQSIEPKTASGQGDLKLKAVKTPPDSSNDSEEVHMVKVKKENVEPGDVLCQSEMADSPSPVISHNCSDERIKKETKDLKLEVSDTLHNHVVVRSDFKLECKPVTPEIPEPSFELKVEPSPMETVQSQNSVMKPTDLPASLSPKTPAPPQTPQSAFSFGNIPPQCLKLSSYNIIVPEVLKAPVPPGPEVLQSPAEMRPAVSSSRQARHQFMEFHQSLCRLISTCVSESSHRELWEWLSSLKLDCPPAKAQKVSGLLGSKARKVWLRGEETVTSLQKVLGQFENYVRTRECPFPHVIRAGAVFIPMLVVKEVLFPQVQGTFIDQVLQEHKVELRPTTLSEERHLTQLHRRAFSSKLRRLLSLKHLPDVYPDILNLLYYDSTCKFLGVDLTSTFKQESAECSDEAVSFVDEQEMHCRSPRPQTPDTIAHLENLKDTSFLQKRKSKGRVKSACKRMFLRDDSSSPEDEPDGESTSWCFEGSLSGEGWENVQDACINEEGHIEVKIEEDTEQEPENYWGRPLTSDDFSSGSSDAEMEMASWSSPQNQSPGSLSTNHSGMVLKLRKVYYTSDRQGQVSHYQRVLDHSEAPEMKRGGDGSRHQRRKKEHGGTKYKKRHTFSYGLRRPQNCPYLSKQRASQHSRRWVLRSAVQTARQTLRKRYPDLVGKRIRHLYEENDKTEVWYRGVVLRIHEPHHNPLKTVFEVKYDSEPEWQYYLELLVDYKKGWLKIED